MALHIIRVKDFSTPHFSVETSCKQKLNRYTIKLTEVMNQIDLSDIIYLLLSTSQYLL